MNGLKDGFILNNGVKIPCIGYGTWLTTEEMAEEAVKKADRFTQSSFQAYLLFCVLSNSYCCCYSCSHENKHRPCDLKSSTVVPEEQAAFETDTKTKS